MNSSKKELLDELNDLENICKNCLVKKYIAKNFGNRKQQKNCISICDVGMKIGEIGPLLLKEKRKIRKMSRRKNCS